MSQQKHTKLRLRIIAELWSVPYVEVITKEAGALVGYPDLFLCVRGHFIGAEIKIPPDKPTKMQIYRLKRIEKAGGSTYIVKPTNFKWFIREMKKRAAVKSKDLRPHHTSFR